MPLKEIHIPFLNFLFPPICPVCEDAIETDGLCGDCLSKIKKIESPFCGVCGMPFTSKAQEMHVCGECLKNKVHFTKARSGALYEGLTAEMIRRFKYNGDLKYLKTFGNLMTHSLKFLAEKVDIITPVPLHKTRLKQRGFNHSLVLAREAAKVLKVRVDYRNLKRIRDTPSQIHLKRDEREKNIKGAFSVEAPEAFKNKKILLIDDVFTTGATVRECAKMLKKTGAEVFVITLARTSEV